MSIVFVKKILASGEPCPKCVDVEKRLARDGHLARIDRVVVADERDPSSEGMRLAAEHDVHIAPFFVVDNGEKTTIYTVFLRLVREVLGGSVETGEEAQEILRANPDLDLI